MEFAVLAAGVAADRQRVEQAQVEAAAGKRCRQFLQVDDGKMRLDPGIVTGRTVGDLATP